MTKDEFIVKECFKLLPENWASYSNPTQILQFVSLVLADINLIPPVTSYSLDSLVKYDNQSNSYFPASPVWDVLKFGVSFYSLLFHQMRATLQDFNFSDQGLSVSVDQTAKVGTSIQNMAQVYLRMVTNLKKTETLKVGATGVVTPRYQSQLGQFLKIALGSAFNWNMP
ncbi:MAG: hypothetical protein QXY18_01025 [Nitrososphaerota archaeon]